MGIAVMARYEHLPIYKKAMDLSIYLEEAVRNFSRYHKYAIGAELSNSGAYHSGADQRSQFRR